MVLYKTQTHLMINNNFSFRKLLKTIFMFDN